MLTPRVPLQYALHLVSIAKSTKVVAMWAFSVADVIEQWKFEQHSDVFDLKFELEKVEPWRVSAHGPWPEELK